MIRSTLRTMEATNSPQTWGTSTLKPVEKSNG